MVAKADAGIRATKQGVASAAGADISSLQNVLQGLNA